MLPDGLCAVDAKDLVGAEDGELLLEGLGDEQAVEGVAVMRWERFEVEDVLVTDGKEFHAIGVHLVADVGDG